MVIKRKLYRIKLTRSLSYKVLSEGKYNIFNIVFPTRHPVDKDSIVDSSQTFTLVPHFMEKMKYSLSYNEVAHKHMTSLG